MQGNAEGEEEEEEGAAEGAGGDEEGDEDEDLSPLVCIIWDRNSVTEGNLYRLVFAKEIKQLWPNCERNILLETVQSTQTALHSSPPHSQAPFRPWDGQASILVGRIDCEWITFNYRSYSEGSQSQRLKAADMDHVLGHSAFNPAHVIKDGRGGRAAATSGALFVISFSCCSSYTLVGKAKNIFLISMDSGCGYENPFFNTKPKLNHIRGRQQSGSRGEIW